MKHLATVCTATIVLLGALAAQAAEPAPAVASGRVPSFRHDIIPVLNKFGCNSGGCHGKASGQNGFKLSLFSFDPEADFTAIVQEGLGRRVSQTAPDASLLLRKATGQVAHGGGPRFAADSGAYRLLKQWIAAGTPWGSPKEAEFVGLQVNVPPSPLGGEGRG